MTESKISDAKFFTIYENTTDESIRRKPMLSIRLTENGLCEHTVYTDKLTINGVSPTAVPNPTEEIEETTFLTDKPYNMEDAFELWCKTKENTIKSYKDEKTRIERYIMAPLGHLLLTEINAPLVIQTVGELDRSGKQATLKRVLMRLREMLDLAVCAGYITHNPCPRVATIFTSPKTEPMKSLPWNKVSFIIRRVIELAPDLIRDMFLLQLATMCRPNEIAYMEKKWIGRDTINIPKENMKMGRDHRIPITPLIRRILDRCIERHPNSPYLFVGRDENRPISAQCLAKWLHSKKDFKDKLVAHGLRSIARSWMADKGVNFEVAERCLAHVVGNSIQKAYQRSDLLNQRKKVLLEWFGYLDKFVLKYEEMYCSTLVSNKATKNKGVLEVIGDEDDETTPSNEATNENG